LIRLEVARESPSIQIIESLRSYTRYTLYLSVVVIASTAMERSFDYVTNRLNADESIKSRQIVTLSRQAQNCRESISGLVGSEGTGRSPEKFHEVARLVYTNCFSVMQQIEDLK
jgi:hypothetical protein